MHFCHISYHFCELSQIAICIVGIILIITYMAIWLILINSIYEPFEKAIPYNEEMRAHFYEDSDYYNYSVSKPSPYFLTFTGNLSISKSVGFDTKGRRVGPDGSYPYIGTDINMIIWPKIGDGYKICVSIIEYDGSVDNNGASITKSYEYLLDENKRLLENLSLTDMQDYYSHIEDINYIYEKMNSMWEITTKDAKN